MEAQFSLALSFNSICPALVVGDFGPFLSQPALIPGISYPPEPSSSCLKVKLLVGVADLSR